ncbi:hypothetical protein N7540_008383 [Penicillium herquei]|nr:hypothetical protein N7540_008383 [Penicillium herquei]
MTKKHGKAKIHHCPLKSGGRGNCRTVKGHCVEHQTVCSIHNIVHLKDEACPACEKAKEMEQKKQKKQKGEKKQKGQDNGNGAAISQGKSNGAAMVVFVKPRPPEYLPDLPNSTNGRLSIKRRRLRPRPPGVLDHLIRREISPSSHHTTHSRRYQSSIQFLLSGYERLFSLTSRATFIFLLPAPVWLAPLCRWWGSRHLGDHLTATVT